MLVKEIMTTKVVYANPEDPIQKIAALLFTNGFHGIPVVRKDTMTLVGIITESDFFTRDGLAFYLSPYLDKVKDKNMDMSDKERSEFNNMIEARAKDIMKIDPVMIEPEANIQELTKIFSNQKIHTVPVASKGELVGIVTMADMVKLIQK
jgi:CBS domain-containing protein